jgi:hypothetical protein
MFANNIHCVPLAVEHFFQDKNLIGGGIVIRNTESLLVKSMRELMLAMEKKELREIWSSSPFYVAMLP